MTDGPRRARDEGRRHRLRLRAGADARGDEARRRAPRRRSLHPAAAPAPARVRSPRRSPSATSSSTPSLDVAGDEKRDAALARRRAARAADPRVHTRRGFVAEELREILIATSDGKLVRDRQPLMRFGVRVIAEHDGKRQSGISGGGGRMTLELLRRASSPEWHAQRGGAPGALDARRAARRRPARWKSCSRPATAASCLHEAVGHGLEADFNRKGTSNYTRSDRQARRERAVHGRRRRHAAAVARHRSTSTTKATSRARSVLIENGMLVGYMHDRLGASTSSSRPTGNGRRESFARAPDAAHDEHAPARRPARSRGDPRRA